ncbi:hypothetical protein FLA_1982 [Filimonas lacunae]|nr:hypothetical protein FLA_1982 [Filimonas lacunae]
MPGEEEQASRYLMLFNNKKKKVKLQACHRAKFYTIRCALI